MGRQKAENLVLVALRAREPSRIPPAPKELSPKWQAEWREHHEDHDEWGRHEGVILAHAFTWWTREDDFTDKAEKAKNPREKRALQVQARDCGLMGLRFYRTLEFEPEETKKKRAGRKSDTGYSEIRGAGAGCRSIDVLP